MEELIDERKFHNFKILSFLSVSMAIGMSERSVQCVEREF